MQKQVDIEKIGIALEDIEDIRDNVNDLIAVPLIDLKKEIKRIVKDLDTVIKDIESEIGDYIALVIKEK